MTKITLEKNVIMGYVFPDEVRVTFSLIFIYMNKILISMNYILKERKYYNSS